MFPRAIGFVLRRSRSDLLLSYPAGRTLRVFAFAIEALRTRFQSSPGIRKYGTKHENTDCAAGTMWRDALTAPGAKPPRFVY